MAGAAIAAGIGLTGMAATVAAIAINFAVAFAASYLVAKAAMKSVNGSVSAADYKQTIQSDKQAQRVVYGKRKLGVVLNFAEEQEGTQAISDKTGESGELLYLSGMICNHPVNSILEVHLDDKLLSEYGANVELGHVNGTGEIPEFLIYKDAQYDEHGDLISAASGAKQYDESMTGSNGYWLAAKLKHDSTVFSGIPDILVTIEGKRIKDLRTGQMVYSNNLALVIADFYINYMGVPEERLITSGYGSFVDAANLCDEITETGEPRYTINGMFELNQTPSAILNEMLLSGGATLVRSNGQIGLLPAAYYGTPTFTIGESDIVGGISMSPQEAMGDAVNIMQGKYVSPDDDWNEQDFTPIRDEQRITQDGYEITEEITYSFVTNEYQAQRLANIELRRRIAGGFFDLVMNPKGAYCRVGRVVNLELPQFGLSGEYRVLSQSENEDLTFNISLQKDDIDIYDDAVGEPYVPPPNLDLGGVGVAAPSGLQFTTTYNDSVGNVIQGMLTWQNNSASTQYFDVKVENADTDEEIQAAQVPSTNYKLNALAQGNYRGRVRAVNARGETSSWVETQFSIGIPAAPADWYLKGHQPDGQFTLVELGNWNIEITPNIDGGVPQGTQFEFYYLADSASHVESAPTYGESDIGQAELISMSTSLNKGSMTPDRWAHFWVRSVNSYGKSDFIYIQVWTTKDQELITTVVEKLQAVEIESANWTPENTGISDYGYKLYSPNSDPVTMPDGTVLQNPDGLAVFQNIVANGHITAKSLTFVSDDAIPDSINNDKAVEETKAYVDQNYVDAVTYGTEIADIQAQLDKSITSWFGDATPTADNYPAVDWTTDELKDQHLGDLYYDNDDGLSYRWSLDNGTYLWIRVVDSGIEAALAAAAKAQDTADSKRRVFFGTPVPPYDRGDLWDTGDGIKRCDVASTTTYSPSHWIWSTDGSGAADAAELAAKQHADQKAATAEANAKLYADAEAELARITAEAYADGIVDEEEARAIADAQAKADIAEANAKAASDPKGSADAALIAANTHAEAEAHLAQVTAEAYADGVADDAELEAIAEAQRLADAAEEAAKAASDPKGSASAAEQAAKAHADAQANLAQVTAEAYADGIVDEEEARAIADAQAKADAAEQNAKQYADEIPNPVIFSDDTRRTILRDLEEFETVNIDAEYSGTHVLRVIQEVANDLSWSLNGVEQPAIESLDTFVTVELIGGNNVLVFWDKGEFTDPQIVVTLIEMTSVGGNSAESYVENRIYPDQDNLQIQGNYQQGVSGWAIDVDGNSEFNNILARGRMESSVFQGGMIIGSTIYAVDEEILADPYGDGTPTFYLSHPEIPVSVLPQVVSTNTIATPVYAQFDLYSAADNYTEPDQRRSKEIVLPAGAMTGSYTYPRSSWGVNGKQGDVSFSDFYNRSQTVTLRFVETDSGNAHTQSLTFSPIVSSTNYITLGGVSFKIKVTTYYEPESTYSGGHQGEDTYIAKGYFGFNLTVTNEEGNLGNVDDIEKNGLFSLTLTGDSPFWRNTRKYGDQNFYFVTEGRNISASVNLDNEA